MLDTKWQWKDQIGGYLFNIEISLNYYHLTDNYLWTIYLKARKHQSD